jgi:tRNA threonylcarbamoyl adenosine modification protein (Sua5/YciO/YrdC/YwlC family)
LSSDIAGALEALAAGRVGAIPTDTVYGLAASLTAVGAIEHLFRLKGRPRDKPIPVLAHDAVALESVVVFDDRARRLARTFWPGPLTIVLPRAPQFAVDLGGRGTTIAVRVPDHRVALELLKDSGPLAVTSANRSGEDPFTTATGAAAEFGSKVFVVDGGVCDGAPSTIVDLTAAASILREGALGATEVLGELEP